MDFSRRSAQPEVMDTEAIGPAEYARCLRDLEAVNRLTWTHRSTLRWLGRATQALPPDTVIRILDVASGHGDLLRAIHRWVARRGLRVRLEGIDLNPASAVLAQTATPSELAIAYRTGDVFAYAPEPKPDLIVSSQFAHHLTDADVVRFLCWLESNAQRGWFIADLHRHPVPYYGFRVLARLAGWHKVVRTDGTISIGRSFRREEWQRLISEAGTPAEVRWQFPFRICVGRLK
jgi:2-polyprenyl-3-methyl-5-hydroxy-6-metoxy-1,4-benzoquinol methylase